MLVKFQHFVPETNSYTLDLQIGYPQRKLHLPTIDLHERVASLSGCISCKSIPGKSIWYLSNAEMLILAEKTSDQPLWTEWEIVERNPQKMLWVCTVHRTPLLGGLLMTMGQVQFPSSSSSGSKQIHKIISRICVCSRFCGSFNKLFFESSYYTPWN